MLVISRRIGQTVVIGEEEINFTVLGVKGNQVKLGIASESDVSIHRKEVYLRIKEERELGVVSSGKKSIARLKTSHMETKTRTA